MQHKGWYRAESCIALVPDQDQACVRGDACPYAHNVFEYWLHPTRYRSQLCNDGDK